MKIVAEHYVIDFTFPQRSVHASNITQALGDHREINSDI
jgi:hypothetical protein